MPTSNTVQIFKALGFTQEAAELLADVVENTDSVEMAGDVTGDSATNVVEKIQGVDVDNTAPVLNDVLTYDGTKWAPTAASGGASGWFGDGADGDVTIGAGTTTLTRDMFYDTLTVPAGATLKTNGWAVYCKTALDGDGTISADGASVTGTSVGGSTVNGSLISGGIGGDGSVNAGSASTYGNQYSFFAGSGAGGVGFDGGGGTAGGAANGTTSYDLSGNTTFVKSPYKSVALNSANVMWGGLKPICGHGGGGGGGNGADKEGGGGAAGGHLMLIFAKDLAFTGLFTAKGGNGADGQIDSGGGGGGGGGGIVVFYETMSSVGYTTSVLGGTGGAGNGGLGGGGTTSGANGDAGFVYVLQV